MNSETALLRATRPYAQEDVVRSWAAVLSTFALLAASTLAAVSASFGWARPFASLLSALLWIRVFILFHDFMHGAILRGSRIARALLYPAAFLVLTPPRLWRETHNYHHAHTAQLVGSHVGSFPMATTGMWEKMTPVQRLRYRLARHPLTLIFGGFSVFLYGMCLGPLVRSPKKNWQSALALLFSGVVILVFRMGFGWEGVLWGYLLPIAAACAMGSYLFYAQHNFVGVYVQPREQWTFGGAALESSSFMKMGPLMAWFTGNIGYHHVHHFNPGIPFYRLPEAMAALPSLQHPHITTLALRDIIACLKLKLWDPARKQIVPFPRG